MTIACGTDIVYIPTIKNMLAKQSEHTLKRFFHPNELQNSSPEHLAGILAAKEAYFKSIGQVPKFMDIEVQYEDSGKPYLVISPSYNHYSSCDVSISHDKDYAIATVILQK